MREPTIMRWPGKIPAGKVCSEVAATIDFLPTIAALAGTRPPTDRVIDGKNILPLMLGEAGATSPHEAFFYYRGTALEAARAGKWKLRIERKGGKKPKGKAKPQPPTVKKMLFDLEADISETTDVAAKHPDVVERLSKVMADFDKALKADRRGKA
jgi:arylsulfatase A-like enzyme